MRSYNLNEYQKAAVNANEDKVVVLSAAGSGKTTCIVERIKVLLERGVDPSEIVAITFTNSAAKQMLDRVGNNNIYISTIHSYCNYLLLSGGIDTSELLNNEDFDGLFKLIKENPQCLKHVSHLIVDEFNDQFPQQIEFFEMLKPDNYFFVGDPLQTLYTFLKSDPEYMLNLMKQPGVTTYRLPLNYRSGRNILGFAKRIVRKTSLGLEDTSIPMNENPGTVAEVEYSNETVLSYINKTLSRGYDYKDWFILCRSNAQVDDVKQYMESQNVPCATFKRAELTEQEMHNLFNENSVKIMTIHASKSMEAPCVAVVGGLFYNDTEKRVCYVAATRAKDLLVWCNRPKKIKKKAQPKMTNWE